MARRIKACAKINLALEVLGRREDGYHEVSSVLHAVGLADELAFEPADDLTLDCDEAAVAGEKNLVMRAARLLQEASGRSQGARIGLRKGIPVAAGLGGGSSDAAATLRGLNDLWGVGLSPQELYMLGAKLGSDVPFFLQGSRCALAVGRGEAVTPLPAVEGWWAVVLFQSLPAPPNKTSTLYSMLTESDYTDGSRAAALSEGLQRGRLDTGGLYNAFERVAGEAFAGLDEYRQVFKEAGAPFVALAGSGPALYALVDSEEECRMLGDRLLGQGYEGYVAALAERTVEGE